MEENHVKECKEKPLQEGNGTSAGEMMHGWYPCEGRGEEDPADIDTEDSSKKRTQRDSAKLPTEKDPGKTCREKALGKLRMEDAFAKKRTENFLWKFLPKYVHLKRARNEPWERAHWKFLLLKSEWESTVRDNAPKSGCSSAHGKITAKKQTENARAI